MSNYLMWAGIVIVVAFVLFRQFKRSHAHLSGEEIRGKVRYVVDGDSLFLNGHKPQVRLWGVDAPEKNEAGFKAATDTLKRIAQGKRVTCLIVERDRYKRTVARCFLADGQEINAAMIRSGTAREYRKFTKGFYSR